MNNLNGYRIFFRYLELIWEEERSDCIGGLLGGMILLEDGSTADLACASDWEDATANSSNKNDPYKIGIQFLIDWLAIGYNAEIDKIRLDMELNKKLNLWQKATRDVLNNNDDIYLKF